jgi:hypothetical protein
MTIDSSSWASYKDTGSGRQGSSNHSARWTIPDDPPDPHHLVAATLKLVRHDIDRDVERQFIEFTSKRVHESRTLPAQGQQWEDP